MNPLRRVLGGLLLPSVKQASTQSQIQQAPLPPFLVLPLSQHQGEPAQACVRPGDRVLKGQLVAQAGSGLSLPVHASSSGWVRAIQSWPLTQALDAEGPAILIETDGQDQAVEPRLGLPYWEQSPDRVREQIRQAGIAGLGGAVFPTYAKLQRPVDCLILNGVECEPYISADQLLLRERPRQVLEGGRILAQALGARALWLVIEQNQPQVVAALRQALSVLPPTDVLAFELIEIPSLYPSGSARQLIQLLTGQEVPSGQRTVDLGFQVQNVGTAAAVYRALVDGEPLVSRITTLAGANLRRPANLEVRLGTPVRELLYAQGLKRAGLPLIMGGPMMGFQLSSDRVPVVKATNAILSPAAGEWTPPGPEQPCIRCGDCQPVCPAGLLPQQLYWHLKSQDWTESRRQHLPDCIECGACAYVCPSDIPLVAYFRYGKQQLRNQDAEQQAAEAARFRFEARTERLAQLREQRGRKAPVPILPARAAEPQTASPAGLLDSALAHAQASLGPMPPEPSPATQDAAAAARKALIEAAVARTQAKQSAAVAQADAIQPTDAEQTATQPNLNPRSELPLPAAASLPPDAQVASPDDAAAAARKALIEAAVARAKARKQAQAEPARSQPNESPDD